MAEFNRDRKIGRWIDLLRNKARTTRDNISIALGFVCGSVGLLESAIKYYDEHLDRGGLSNEMIACLRVRKGIALIRLGRIGPGAEVLDEVLQDEKFCLEAVKYQPSSIVCLLRQARLYDIARRMCAVAADYYPLQVAEWRYTGLSILESQLVETHDETLSEEIEREYEELAKLTQEEDLLFVLMECTRCGIEARQYDQQNDMNGLYAVHCQLKTLSNSSVLTPRQRTEVGLLAMSTHLWTRKVALEWLKAGKCDGYTVAEFSDEFASMLGEYEPLTPNQDFKWMLHYIEFMGNEKADENIVRAAKKLFKDHLETPKPEKMFCLKNNLVVSLHSELQTKELHEQSLLRVAAILSQATESLGEKDVAVSIWHWLINAKQTPKSTKDFAEAKLRKWNADE